MAKSNKEEKVHLIRRAGPYHRVDDLVSPNHYRVSFTHAYLLETARIMFEKSQMAEAEQFYFGTYILS